MTTKCNYITFQKRNSESYYICAFYHNLPSLFPRISQRNATVISKKEFYHLTSFPRMTHMRHTNNLRIISSQQWMILNSWEFFFGLHYPVNGKAGSQTLMSNCVRSLRSCEWRCYNDMCYGVDHVGHWVFTERTLKRYTTIRNDDHWSMFRKHFWILFCIICIALSLFFWRFLFHFAMPVLRYWLVARIPNLMMWMGKIIWQRCNYKVITTFIICRQAKAIPCFLSSDFPQISMF